MRLKILTMESMYQILEEPAAQTINSASQSIDSIVLLVDSFFGAGKKSYDISIMGASMKDWVARACPSAPTFAEYSDQLDLLSTIKPLIKSAEYTLVLFSDTPLITKNAVKEMLDFAITKNLSVARFNRGYVFKTEYIKSALNIYAINSYDTAKNLLEKIDNIKKLERAKNVLKQRILDFHIANNVQFLDASTTYVECGVSIDAFATIGAHTTLAGKTVIGANSKIGHHCYVADTIVAENVIIKDHCSLSCAKILDGSLVSSFVVLADKTLVDSDCTISSRTSLEGSVVGKNSKIGKDCLVSNTKIAENVIINDGCKLFGTQNLQIKVASGATMMQNVTIYQGVYVPKDTIIDCGNTIKVKK